MTIKRNLRGFVACLQLSQTAFQLSQVVAVQHLGKIQGFLSGSGMPTKNAPSQLGRAGRLCLFVFVEAKDVQLPIAAISVSAFLLTAFFDFGARFWHEVWKW